MQKLNIRYLVATIAFLFAIGNDVCAQLKPVRTDFVTVEVPTASTDSIASAGDSLVSAADSIISAADSTLLPTRDSIAFSDADSLGMLSKSSLDNPAFSTARDSIVEVLSNGRRLIYYYGDVSVTYQDMKLEAEFMEYDLNSGVVYAYGKLDSLTGEWIGQPKMTQGGQTYGMKEVYYNFNTRKAKIHEMITSQDQALMHGRNLKMLEDKSVNMTGGKYTVCDLEHPHYYLALSSARVMTKPKQRTVFGPACLVVEDVPLYFVGIPFGFIPQRPQRATGLLMPNFGEEERRGFYVRGAGAYFVLGDFFDFSVTGDYYTLGSWAVEVNSRYKVNYKFSGNVGFTYSHDVTGEKGTSEYNEMSNFSVKWSHSQDPKSMPGSTFSASVNFSSPSNSKYNLQSIEEALNNQIGSSISFSHNWNGKINLSLNGLHSQNSRDSSYHISLPNISFSVSTFYPFKRKERVGKERFYEKFSLSYSTSFNNSIDFKASEFNQPGFFDKMNNGMNHNFNIGLPSFTLLKYINVNPSFSYGQKWYFRATDYKYDPEKDAVVPVQTGQFQHFGIFQNYSMSMSMNTRLYGMYMFGGKSNLMAIRHVVSPSVSASWVPDQSFAANGYRTLTYIDAMGNEKTYDYNLYGQGKARQSASLNFSFDNNLEAKVRDLADTTGTGSKKVKLIDNFKIGGSYNFMADSMRLSTISMSLSTNLLNKVNLSASASFDPYAINEKGTRYNRLAVASHQGLMRLQTFNTSLSYAIQGEGKTQGSEGNTTKVSSAVDYYKKQYYHPVTNEFIPGGWLYYTNTNAPWSLNFSYNLNLTMAYAINDGRFKATPKLNHYLNLNGNIKLTPKMSINFTSGFDFTAMKVTTTQVNATYDLHCFNISVMWVPLGTYKSYSFRIAANASTLADLLRFRKSSNWRDN